jgi:hypothetical protein
MCGEENGGWVFFFIEDWRGVRQGVWEKDVFDERLWIC